ncbi:hypothetical protein D1B31_12065 [Neobacillus notoginsengisoli]|uniref:Uncharacterized protein n=1 Tax=Neobacillus notoginsengisoli TaxID=1578198 RepID=A0A417YTD5_9BACI|nr:hypothetical protein [Neobacillus notoginsengisoli]RHW40283.1 hypothetical protein D1B31_12065 [Neobacillus notoginsengisoli]
MKEEYRSLLQPLLIQSGSKAKIEMEGHHPESRLVGGKYSLTTHTITLYIEEIKKQCIQLFGSLAFLEAYICIVFAHELGHAEDQALSILADRLDAAKSETEKARLQFLIEKRAWNYAEKLLQKTHRTITKKIITQSLQSYYQEIELQYGA